MDTKQDNTRLFKAVEKSYRVLEPFRKQTHELVQEYAGSGYGSQGNSSRYEILVNLMNQTVDAYTMALVANRPRVKFSTALPDKDHFAAHLEIATNNLIEEIGLEFTLRQWVIDAFFCVGIIKVHLADSGFVLQEQDRWSDPGQPFASNVSLDNFVFDTSATKWEQVKFAGDCYRIPFEDLKQDIYDQEAVAKLSPSSKNGADDDRLDRITRGQEVDDDELQPMIDLCDMWIPREGVIKTFAISSRDNFTLHSDPVAVMEWTGDERGPYFILGFNDVPENIMPSSPAAQLGSLARLANNLIRKQSRQAQRQKQVHAYTPAGEADAARIKIASDGQWVKVQEPQEIETITTGGVDPGNQAFFMGVMDMYDRMAGNLTAMLGLGAQADTASQEQLIHGAVNKKEAQMQYRVVDGTTRLIKSLAFMLWEDQVKTIPGRMEIPGANLSVDSTWRPGYRLGSFEDYKLMVDVYSMAYQSPSQRVQSLNNLLTQTFLPASQMLAQQGGQINLQALTDFYADMLNMPELRKVVQFSVTPPPEAMGMQEGPGMPAATSRTYTRRSVSGGNKTGATQQALQAAMAAKQGAQGRPPG